MSTLLINAQTAFTASVSSNSFPIKPQNLIFDSNLHSDKLNWSSQVKAFKTTYSAEYFCIHFTGGLDEIPKEDY